MAQVQTNESGPAEAVGREPSAAHPPGQSWPRWVSNVALVVVALGALVRLAAYLHTASLWHDETLLAYNFVTHSWSGILQPLDLAQAAPAGFLLLTKLSTALFGEGEKSLRLVPFASSLLTLMLGWVLARRMLPPAAGIAFLAMLAWSKSIVNYATEFKQYSSDVMLALAVLLLAHRAMQVPARRYVLAWGVLAVLTVWFSHPVCFVIGATGLVMLWQFGRGKRVGLAVGVAAAGAASVASFGSHYWLFCRHLRDQAYLQEFWRGAFMPSTSLLEALAWFPSRLQELFAEPFGKTSTWPYGALALVGTWVAWRKGGGLLAATWGAVGLVLLAAMARIYRFADRHCAGLVPGVGVGDAIAGRAEARLATVDGEGAAVRGACRARCQRGAAGRGSRSQVVHASGLGVCAAAH